MTDKIDLKAAKLIVLAAEAEAAAAEARKANAEAKRLEIETEVVQRKREEIEAGDVGYNGVFTLDGEVNELTIYQLQTDIEAYCNRVPGGDITLRIFSPGGNVFDGFVLFDQLRDASSRGHHVTTEVRGYAASMGGVIAQAGDVRRIGRNAYVMIHSCGGGAIGKSFELEDEVAFMKRLEERMVNIYAERATITKRKLQAGFKRKDWWLDSSECIAAGIADEVIG